MSSCVETRDGTSVLVESTMRDAGGGQTKSVFQMDRVFGPSTTQQSVFDSLKPLVLEYLKGYSATLLTYGQTGSGKTYTMTGGDMNALHLLVAESKFFVRRR